MKMLIYPHSQPTSLEHFYVITVDKIWIFEIYSSFLYPANQLHRPCQDEYFELHKWFSALPVGCIQAVLPSKVYSEYNVDTYEATGEPFSMMSSRKQTIVY